MDIKKEAKNKLIRLEAQLNDSSGKSGAEVDYAGIIYRVLENLKNLDMVYLNTDISVKRYIISSIFSEKWTFPDGKHRTVKMNEVFLLIYQLNNKLENKKSRLNVKKNTQSACVPGSRFELPRLFKRHPLKVVRLPISPPGYLVSCKYRFIHSSSNRYFKNYRFKISPSYPSLMLAGKSRSTSSCLPILWLICVK
jgi:hypothetical protein